MQLRSLIVLGFLMLAGCVTGEASVQSAAAGNPSSGASSTGAGSPVFDLPDVKNIPYDVTVLIPILNEPDVSVGFKFESGDSYTSVRVNYGSLAVQVLEDLIVSQFRSARVIHVPEDDIRDFLQYEAIQDEWLGQDLVVVGTVSITGNNAKDHIRFGEMAVRIYSNDMQSLAYIEELRANLNIVKPRGNAVVIRSNARRSTEYAVSRFTLRAAESIYRKMQRSESLTRDLQRYTAATDGPSASPELVPSAPMAPNSGSKGNPQQMSEETKQIVQQIEGAYAPFLNASVVVQHPSGSGSGFYISRSGYIVTNHHVIEGASRITIENRDGSIAIASAVASDPERDLAILKVGREAKNFLSLGTISDIQLGSELFVIGAPRGLEFSLSKGTISAVRVEEEKDIVFIQTDAAINPGNSGGPMISERTGNVVGVSTWKLRQAEGLNFGVSVNEIYELIDEANLTIE